MDARLTAARRRWGVTVGDRLSGGFRSDVYAGSTVAGTEVVVKLPATAAEAAAEVAALTAWASTGAAVQLLDVDDDHHVLLLERVRPGTPLPQTGDVETARVAADLLARLHHAAPGPFPFHRLEEIYPGREARARTDLDHERRSRHETDRGQPGPERLDAARATVSDLCGTTPEVALLHGDGCAKNVLRRGGAHVMIDPMPHLGDPCADIGHIAADQPVATILDTARVIAASTGRDPHRARRWAAVWTVVQATQAWRADQDELDALLVCGEIDLLLRAR